MAVIQPSATSLTTGRTELSENIGKDIQVINVAKTNITTAELNTMMETLSMTTTVIAIKGAAAFDHTNSTTDAFNVIIEGGSYTVEGSNALGVTGAVTTIPTGFAV